MKECIFLCSQNQKNLEEQDIYYYDILTQQGQSIGYCYLNLHPVLSKESGNIGYFIHEIHRGHAYSYDATMQMFQIALQKGYNEISVFCKKDNFYSRRICQHLKETFPSIECHGTNNMIIYTFYILQSTTISRERSINLEERHDY